MKLTTQLTVVICTAIISLLGMIYFLSEAGWSFESISGMVAGIGTAVALLVGAIRQNAKQAEAIDHLQQQVGTGQRSAERKLDTVVHQTNGMSDAAMNEVADRAAVKVIEAYRRGDLR